MVSTRSMTAKGVAALESASQQAQTRPSLVVVLRYQRTPIRRSARLQAASTKVVQQPITGRVRKPTRRASGTAVSRKTKVVVQQSVSSISLTRRRSNASLKIVLSNVKYSLLSEFIQQQDYKILRQQRRLSNYKGRYFPPPIRSYNNRYQFKFGHNPFTHLDFAGPSAEQQWHIYNVIKKDLKENYAIECFLDQPDASTNELQGGPMHISDELTVDNLVKVILSISTENSLAHRQHEQLCSKFTYTVDGKEVKGKVPNYHKMRKCSPEELVRALNIAGHHNLRQKAFHAILQDIYEQNIKLLPPGELVLDENELGATDFVPGMLSLDYLKGEGLSKQERFDMLVRFAQIAVKTGCCLLAFHLKIPVFVVDTHVHHMTRNLQWIPENCYDADKACMFLDTIMPAELKFGLHQAFWHHRIRCERCKPRACPTSKAYMERICPLEPYLKRDLPPMSRLVSRENSDKEATLAKNKTTKKKTPKKLAASVTFLKIHYKVADEKGYALRKVQIDDDFGDGSRQNMDSKATYYWGQKEFTLAKDIVKLEEALEGIGMKMDEYESIFIKKTKSPKGTKKRVSRQRKTAMEELSEDDMEDTEDTEETQEESVQEDTEMSDPADEEIGEYTADADASMVNQDTEMEDTT